MDKCAIVSLVLALSFFVLVDAKPASAVNPVKQSPEDLKIMFQNLQRQLDEENAYQNYQNVLDASRRLQYGTIKTRRAPSPNGYDWDNMSMMQSLDNLRKPRFGR